MRAAPQPKLKTPVSNEEIIASALASKEWRLRDLVSPDGEAVRTILLSLQKMGRVIVAKEDAKP